MSRRLGMALVLSLGLGLVACSDDDTTTPPDSGPADARADRGQQPDAGADLNQWDSGAPDVEILDDVGPTLAGEICQNPIVLTWEGQTIVREDDTTDYRHDYLFGQCAGIELDWEYPNEDIVYRLDFPPGSYHAKLVPDKSYAYFSIIDVRTSSCGSFEDSCTMLADSEYIRTTVNYVFEIAQGETVYFVVDSYGQIGCGVEGDCNGPYTLTIEQFEPVALGGECVDRWQCADEMTCLDPEAFSQETSFCTDYCETVDCANGVVPMSCMDVGPVHYPHGTMACVQDGELGTIGEFGECSWSYACQSGLCVFPSSAWEAECRTPCSGSCASLEQTCVDVSADIGLAQGADPVRICTPQSAMDTRARGETCIYSYECQGDDLCVPAVGICAAP